ncbi:MAG: single-stranded DNA-binding protein [Gammaproteobacteria bacterium]|nr:single-stranded DNA-binding protein [Gammaproteobacteria bacterium]
MRDLNCCHFIGRLGSSPEATYLPNGDVVVNFSIACSDDYKDKDRNNVERTNWIRIVAFRNLGELVHKYCIKGSQVFVSGKQRTKKWTNKNGDDQYTTEIVADNVQFLGKKDDVKNIPSHQAPEITEELQDGIPF